MSQQDLADIYDRTRFANSLINIALKVHSPFSIGVDAKWGNGKTTFVKQFLKKSADRENLPMIVFDCFEHERAGDPFFSITQHILSQLTSDKSDSLTEEVKKQVGNAALKVAKAGGVILMKAFTKTVLKQELADVVSELGGEQQSDVIAEETSGKIEDYIAAKLQNGNQEAAAKANFHKAVEELASLNTHKKILVVIDELDRCKPKFSLEVLESIKHLLNASGLVFVITYYREQLCSSVKHEFGDQIDANQYLHKFVNIDFSLPTQKLIDNAESFETLVRQFLTKFPNLHTNHEHFLNYLNSYNQVYAFEARTIERICTLYAISGSGRLPPKIQILLLVWIVKERRLIEYILQGNKLPKDFHNTLKINELSVFIDLDTIDHSYHPYVSPQIYLDTIFDGDTAQNNNIYRWVQSYVNGVASLV